MQKNFNANKVILIAVCIAFLITACAVPTPSVTPSPTITQTNTPLPTSTNTPTNTPQPTPLPDYFDGMNPIVAYEAVGVERDRDGKATGNCSIVQGKSICKRFIYIGDPSTTNPWGQYVPDGRPIGDWKKVEVFRPADFKNPQALALFNNGKSLLYVKELTDTGATISIYNLETDENKDYPFLFGVGNTLPFEFVKDIEAIKVSPDGKWALIGVADMENTAYLFDVTYGTTKKITNYANQVVFDPESKLFFIGNDAYMLGSGIKTSLPASFRLDTKKIRKLFGGVDTSFMVNSHPDPWMNAILSEVYLPIALDNSDNDTFMFALTPVGGEPKLVYSIVYSGNAPYAPLAVGSPDSQNALIYHEGKLANISIDSLPFYPTEITSMTEGAWFPDGSKYVFVKRTKSNRIALGVYLTQTNIGSDKLIFDPDPLINSNPSPNWGAAGFSIIWPQ